MKLPEFLKDLLKKTDFEIIANSGFIKLKNNNVAKITLIYDTYITGSMDAGALYTGLKIKILNEDTGTIDAQAFLFNDFLVRECKSVVSVIKLQVKESNEINWWDIEGVTNESVIEMIDSINKYLTYYN
jgi:hypothetical protein